jgi:hypothetical protein
VDSIIGNYKHINEQANKQWGQAYYKNQLINIRQKPVFLVFASRCVSTTNNTNSAVNAIFFLLIWVTLHVSTIKESSSGVSSYTLLITELQSEMPILLLTYTDHKVATLMFIYILRRILWILF